MHLVFGMSLDGQAYPEIPGGGRGALGAVVGPSGLLGLLSDQLGLGVRQASAVVRIARWRSKMLGAGLTQPRFWAESFDVDSWSTAEQVLSWRDALREAGWSADRVPNATGRLADIAAAEGEAIPLPTGRCDLLVEITERLESGEPLNVDRLELIDGRDLLPTGWRRLVDAIEAAGVAVTTIEPAQTADAGTDLGRVQRFLSGAAAEALSGDGSFIEATAATSLMAAELVAEWLAADERGGEGTVVLAPDGDTTLLDRAFANRGLPRLGASAASPHRGTLQVLSLAFAVLWRPLDPRKLVELLLLPRPPIDPWAARRFADALAREPGLGSPALLAVWERVREKLEAFAQAQGDDPSTVDLKLERWRSWLSGGLYDAQPGMPLEAAIDTCTRVETWATQLDAGRRDPLLLCVVGAARDLRDALRTLGQPELPRTLIERMIDQAVGEGLCNPDHVAEAGEIRVADDPAALWGRASRVVWWNFAGGGAGSAFPWSEAEQAALRAAGCCLETPMQAARRESAGWERALLNATDAVLLVRPTRVGDEPTVSHPLAHKLRPLLDRTPAGAQVRQAAEALLVHPQPSVAGRNVARAALAEVTLSEPKAAWQIAPAAACLEARVESATSLENLLSCQFRWVLQYLARLRPGSLRQLPNAHQLLGNLAHALAQEVFTVGEVPDPERVRTEAAARLEPLIEKIAAPLLQPGHAADLADARHRVPEALVMLAEHLAERKIAVQGTELAYDRDFGDGLTVTGRVDMVVETADGRTGIIDLKWTTSSGRHRELLKEGKAIQLATYGRLIDPTGDVPAGYYLLNQRRLVAPDGAPFGTERVETTRDLAGTWEVVREAWGASSTAVRDGLAVAAGVEGAADLLPDVHAFGIDDGVCRYCDYRALCRVTVEVKSW